MNRTTRTTTAVLLTLMMMLSGCLGQNGEASDDNSEGGELIPTAQGSTTTTIVNGNYLPMVQATQMGDTEADISWAWENETTTTTTTSANGSTTNTTEITSSFYNGTLVGMNVTLYHAAIDIRMGHVAIENDQPMINIDRYHGAMVLYLQKVLLNAPPDPEGETPVIPLQYSTSVIGNMQMKLAPITDTVPGEGTDPTPPAVDNRPPIGTDHTYYGGTNKGAGKAKDPSDKGALIFGRADLDKALNDGYSMQEVYQWLKDNKLREWDAKAKDFTNMKGSGMTKLFPNTEDPSQHQELSEEELRANDGDGQAREKLPPGTWKVTATIKNAAYNQRFLVHSAKSGNGAYVNKGATATVEAENDWYVNIQNDKGTNFTAMGSLNIAAASARQ